MVLIERNVRPPKTTQLVKPQKTSKQKQTSLISPRDAESVANLLTNATTPFTDYLGEKDIHFREV